jgi:hypothetical protein
MDVLVGESAESRPKQGREHVDPDDVELPRGDGRAYGAAGFIDAPVTGPPKRASSATIPPIAIAAASPTARAPAKIERECSDRLGYEGAPQRVALIDLIRWRAVVGYVRSVE